MASLSFADLAAAFAGSGSFLSLVEKSKPAPALGVFGVLACPKDANAPLPNPKADEAPTLGDLAVAGEAALKGFDFPCADRGPNALGESSLPLLFVSRSRVGNEILSLVLY